MTVMKKVEPKLNWTVSFQRALHGEVSKDHMEALQQLPMCKIALK